MKDRWKGPNGKILISMREAVIRTGASQDTVRRLVQAGELSDFRYSDRGWRWIELDSVLSWIARRAHIRKGSGPRKTKTVGRTAKR